MLHYDVSKVVFGLTTVTNSRKLQPLNEHFVITEVRLII